MCILSTSMNLWLTEVINMKRIGILALQGAFREHVNIIKALGHDPVEVRKTEDLNDLHGIILPGGESTAMGKLLVDFGIRETLSKKIEEGLPVWGTCAGMILLAGEIVGDSTLHIPLMDIKVKRNAYGRQAGSFFCEASVLGIASDIKMPFIRAPYIEGVKDGVHILSVVNGNIVAAKQENMLVTSFHPELTDDTRIHRYFIDTMTESFSV